MPPSRLGCTFPSFAPAAAFSTAKHELSPKTGVFRPKGTYFKIVEIVTFAERPLPPVPRPFYQ